jgi:putative transcriptional regulator
MNITDQEREMNDELFGELLQSLREAGAYLRGEADPARVTFVGEQDPRAMREERGMSEEEFAAELCISVDALRAWERGHRPASRER